MSKNLVIVESPAKAKTIEKYLGKDYRVIASYGHVRDLVAKDGAVDTDHDFAMTYEIGEDSVKNIKAIEKALKSADNLLLATDPDREGEAISWHLYEILNDDNLLTGKKVCRVVFHEITRAAIEKAIAHPRQLERHLIDAYRARRALDHLVGFKLSPLLWHKIRPGLSAGRVQSPALRLIVERENEIKKFKPREYWRISADLMTEKQPFSARLTLYENEKIEQFTITKGKRAEEVKAVLEKEANGKLTVVNVDKKQRKRQPPPPFITSTLQQEAARKLGFTARRTMQVAQRLYEAGLISYMRTDSTQLSAEAVSDIRAAITKLYGKENVPESPRVFKTKAKNAQEAHEAIRPTQVDSHPDQIALADEQKKLYTLIWRRAVACQMIHATIDTVAVDFSCGERNRFRANGSVIANPGFMAVYLEGSDDEKEKEKQEEGLLPPLAKGQEVDLKEILCSQHFTEPPPRYSEASLIKTLEEYGIGRPSTYASIIYTLKSREYVILDKKRFYPTDVGEVVNHFLTSYFQSYVDYDFTAKLEDQLDAVSRGEEEWIPLLKEFWQPFKAQVDDTSENVKRSDVTETKTDKKCPECDKPLVEKLGRRGKFIACTGYPDCSYTADVEDSDKPKEEPVSLEGRFCPKCEKPLVVKHGRYGKFAGCSGYPDCKHIEPLVKPKDTGVSCPECKKGHILQKRTRKGTFFFACSEYPTCKYALWNEPVAEPCPTCKWPILSRKETKKAGKQKVCPQKECDYIADDNE
ncbi:MAG: type I DNA topoisomerase [Gammaproteobacteria bacterium]|nr:type I DNA topoisomerase [Gammaproteobacteria bacterium]